MSGDATRDYGPAFAVQHGRSWGYVIVRAGRTLNTIFPTARIALVVCGLIDAEEWGELARQYFPDGIDPLKQGGLQRIADGLEERPLLSSRVEVDKSIVPSNYEVFQLDWELTSNLTVQPSKPKFLVMEDGKVRNRLPHDSLLEALGDLNIAGPGYRR